MKKHYLISLLGIVALVATFVACSDSPNFGEQETQNNNELILNAKAIVQSQGNSVSLPTPHKHSHHGNESRSISHLADLIPLWDRATIHVGGNETILIVPLQSDEEIRSRVFIKHGEATSYQFAKTFSRLIVKGDQAYVLTYMPESNYASSHSDIENELKYNPTDVNFTGLIVSSRLDGEVMKGFLYNEGILEHYFAPATQECHDHNCTENHNHSHEHNGLSLKFNLQNANQSRSTTYNSNSEDFKCVICGYDPCKCEELMEICQNCYRMKKYCICTDVEKNYCLDCGHPKEQCICLNSEGTEQCPWCGMTYYKDEGHSCESGTCDVCKSKPCICNTPPIDEEKDPCEDCGKYPCECPSTPIDTCNVCNQYPCACCDVCGEYPCICVTDLLPNEYVAHDKDIIIGEESAFTGSGDCCAMAVVAMAHRAYGTEKTESDMYQLYTELNVLSPEESTVLDINNVFMTSQFNMGTTDNLAQTATSSVIIVRYDRHYVLVVGVQYDGDLIYADPHNGGLYVVNESYFSGCENIVIYGNGSKSLKLNNLEDL